MPLWRDVPFGEIVYASIGDGKSRTGSIPAGAVRCAATRYDRTPSLEDPSVTATRRAAGHLGSENVSGSTLSRTLNSVTSMSWNFSPSRLTETLVAFLIPPKSL